jgi:hypothetical protein
MNAMTRRPPPLQRTAAALIVGDELLNGWRADSRLMKIAVYESAADLVDALLGRGLAPVVATAEE